MGSLVKRPKPKLPTPKELAHNREHIWVTRDGRQIPVKELNDGHLLNIHRFLGRQLQGARQSLASGLIFQSELLGETSEHYAAQGVAELEEFISDLETIRSWIKEEMDARNLLPLPLDYERFK